MQGVRSGNSWDDGTLVNGAKTGWFVGPYLPEGLNRTDRFEVKWFKHPPSGPSGIKPLSGPFTISILIEGCFQVRFKRDHEADWEEIHTLSHRGDYLIWTEGLYHEWEALEPSTVLTIRSTDKSA